MKRIGLIGGLSWESSAEYYRLINQAVRQKLGGAHSADMLLYSFDFQKIKDLQHAGDWKRLTDLMIAAAQSLKAGGADFLVICSNTMHKAADEIQAAIDIPLLHIADPTGEAITRKGIKKVGLLGTLFTMEQEFYRGRLNNKFGLDVLVPDEAERSSVHAIIYNELINGIVSDASREKFQSVIRNLAGQGAQAVILGCTEIMLLVKDGDAVPVYDTTRLHALCAVEKALAGKTVMHAAIKQ